MITFSQLPSNIRVPLFYAELDPSKANSGQAGQRTLIVGQQLPAGTMTAATPVLLQGITWLEGLAGAGSHLASMARWYRRRDPTAEVWVLPIADASGSVAATGTVVLAGTATAAGVLSLYVAGRLVAVPVALGQTAASVATALVAAIGNTPGVPVSASVATATVTFTALNKGLLGNFIDLRLNYLGTAGGEALPAGITATVTAMASGAGNPSAAQLDTAFGNLGDRSYDYVVFPWTDTATLDSLKTWLAAQWDATRMLYGHAFAAASGSLATLQTLGAARNDPHVSIIGMYDGPNPPWALAANFAGAAAVSLRADPATPLHTLALDVLAPPLASRFKLTERNTLLYNGIADYSTDDDGTVRLGTVVTTYQKNAQNVADDSYLYCETLATLAAVLRIIRGLVTSTFGRTKLADDGTTFRPGANIVTPRTIRNAILGWYRRLEGDGLVQQSDTFAANLVVQRNSGNTCRVDGLLPVIPIDQLRQVAALVQFRRATDIL